MIIFIFFFILFWFIVIQFSLILILDLYVLSLPIYLIVFFIFSIIIEVISFLGGVFDCGTVWLILGVGVGLGGRAVGRFGIGVEMGTDMGKGIDSGWGCSWMGMNYGIGVGCSMCYSTDCCRRLRSILYIGYMFQECSSFIFVQELMISTTVCTFQDSWRNSAHPNILPFLPHSNSIPLLTILLNIIIQPQNYIHYIIHHIPYKNI